MCDILQDIHIVETYGEATANERIIRAVCVENVVFEDTKVTVRYRVGKVSFTITFPKRFYKLTID